MRILIIIYGFTVHIRSCLFVYLVTNINLQVMKKRNFKKLTIKKQLISNFKSNVVKGGGRTNGNNCDPIPPPESDPCVTFATCYCSDVNGCQLTFIIDIDGNLTC